MVYILLKKEEIGFFRKNIIKGKVLGSVFNDYLFHSTPYNKEQTQIVDSTLGTPSSHGCIRLSEEDSKWIYDNIPSGSKVIIK